MLQRVGAVTLQRPLVGEGKVPHPTRDHRHHPGHRRMHQPARRALHAWRSQQRPKQVARNPLRQAKQHRRKGPPQQQQRRRHHGKQHVLRHVRRKQPRGQRIERRPQRNADQRNAGHEADRSNRGPPPRLHAPKPVPSTQIHDHGRAQWHHRQAGRAPCRPHAGTHAAHSPTGGTATGGRSGDVARSSAPGIVEGPVPSVRQLCRNATNATVSALESVLP